MVLTQTREQDRVWSILSKIAGQRGWLVEGAINDAKVAEGRYPTLTEVVTELIEKVDEIDLSPEEEEHLRQIIDQVKEILDITSGEKDRLKNGEPFQEKVEDADETMR